MHLSKLSSDHTWHVLLGMRIAEEASWVGLDLLDHKAIARVHPGSRVDNAGDEGTRHAAGAAARDVRVIADWEGIWEGQSGWARSTSDSCVDVCGCQGG